MGFESSYVALSHCWGNEQPTTTTTLNLERYQERIEWEVLPPLFKDAVTLCRKLGFQYLWIDSLCIVQNSTTDREKQSSQMGAIYSNAVLTIAAASSRSEKESFLTPRESTFCHGHEFDFRGRASMENSIVGVRNIGPPTNTTQWLSTRAWTLQEELLSTRLLRYDQTELRWECRTLTTCECNAHPIDELKECPSLASVHNSPHSLHIQWPGLVENYSSRQLIRTSDKLPALAGIASSIAKQSGFEYLAGVWKESIARDLAWRVAWGTFQSPNYIAPSFSWASMGGCVSYDKKTLGETIIEEATVCQSQIFLKGINPFGEVTAGFIVLQAAVTELILKYIPNKDIDRIRII